ncbi:MAG: hypothetical protein ABSD13_08720 [Candidatus Korobacteraceae bacterium]|jgi:hypothetical protein
MKNAKNESLDRFKEALMDYPCTHGSFRVRQWSGASKSTPNLISVFYGKTEWVLYAKQDNNRYGWWGINRNQLQALRDSRQKWYLILLDGSDGASYMLTEGDVDKGIDIFGWKGSETDYEVHPHEFVSYRRFATYDELFRALLVEEGLGAAVG